MTGGIPDELGDLPLHTLRLHDNELNGQLSAWIGSGNQSIDSGNQSIDSGKTMVILDLGRNAFSGEIPAELGNFKLLTVLDLSSNRLRGQIPLELGNLSNLRSLNVWNPFISGCVPKLLLKVRNNDLNLLDLRLCSPSALPSFAADNETRSIVENTAVGTTIGSPITATDPDKDTLTYNLLIGDDADSFTINPATGQLSTKVALDYETKPSYTVWVGVTDGRAADGTDDPKRDALVKVTITVTDESGECEDHDATAISDKSNTGLMADCQALLAAKPHWEIPSKLNWSSSTAITQWDGITVGGTPERVTELVLEVNWLSGRIPAELGRLSNLEVLKVGSFELTGGYRWNWATSPI